MEQERFMDNIFNSELKNYLLLEKTIFEAMAMYEETKDDRIKWILQNNINVAKNQILILIEIISHFVSLEEKKKLEEKVYEKLDNLNEIERKLSIFNK